MNRYNVVIVGAGPAGSFLAYKLGSIGLSVLLLEKETFPRYKICAGGLAKKTYDILLSENKDIKNIVEKKIRKGIYVRNGKLTFKDAKKDLIYMIYRSKLDDFLVKMAVNNNTIHFRDNIIIKNINTDDNTVIYTDKKTENKVSYDVLVGAWGSNKRLNWLVDLLPFESFAVSSNWEGPAGKIFKNYSDEHVVCQIIKGYPGIAGYIFPKSDKITAGLFTSLNSPKNLKKMWDEFIDFWKLDKNIKPSYAIIPIRDFSKPISRKNILLVGDAAGLADPFTGEGIYHAIVSSKIASTCIQKFLKNKDYDLSFHYNEDINKHFFDIQKWGKRYGFLFQVLPNFSFWFGSEFFIGNEILNSFITGEINYNEISKMIKYTFNRIFNYKKYRK